MGRNKGLIAAALGFAAAAALLVSQLRQPPVETPSGPAVGVALAPLASTIIVAGSTGTVRYTNEELTRHLQDESGRMGITGIARPGEQAENPEGNGGGFLGEQLGQPGTREQAEAYIRQFAHMRHNIEKDKDRTVALPGSMAGVIEKKDEGSSLGPSADAPGAWSGLYGGPQEPGAYAVEDAKAWASVWASVSREPAPKLDFASQRVAAVFLGARGEGGSRARIVAVDERKDAVVVRWREEPAPGDGPTAPYALRAVVKDARPLRFERAEPGTKGPRKG